MVKVFVKLANSPDYLEIGQSRNVKIVDTGGNNYTFETRFEEVYLDGWKNPVPSVGPLPVDGRIGAELRNLRVIITVLVHMLGDSVTIQSHELINADNLLILTQIDQADPWMKILRTAPKSNVNGS